MVAHQLRGVDVFSDYDHYATLFRHMPFAFVDKKGIVAFRSNGRRVAMYCGDGIPPCSVSEVFKGEEYGRADVKGKQVVDIGTAFGDSTVYFGIRGAKKVYGYEIIRNYYETCKQNILRNNLADVCSVELCGIGDSNNPLDTSAEIIGAIVDNKERVNLEPIPMKTLKQITDEHQVTEGVLKVDVDGYEYKIFEATDRETFRKYGQIIMEYHYGPKPLIDKLSECGFEVEASKPLNVRIDYHPEQYKNMELGYIVATRR